MPVAVSNTVKSSGHKTISVSGQMTFSGSYATGGDPFVPASLGPGTTKAPRYIAIEGKSGFSYQYDVENAKIKVYSGATETTAGAYPAGITGDVVRFNAVFPKFG